MNTVLSYPYEKKANEFELNVKKMVEKASHVIVPLGPITSFAARHPWVNMEEQSFERVARFLKEMNDVDIFPNDSLIKSAWEQGEIKSEILETGLQNWVNDQHLELDQGVALQYCKAALGLNNQAAESLSLTQLKSVAKKLNRFMPKTTEKHVIQTYSQLLEKQGKPEVMKALNSHMIKWCKLYSDESQAVWSMPNRNRGFYHSWKRLVQHDPALHPSIRKKFSNLPNEPEQSLKEIFIALEIPYTEMIGYLQAHLLALPGWAGMMLWRSQQYVDDKNLLLDYLAVRLSMEWALVQPYLPMSQQKEKNKVSLEQLLSNWFHWGKMPIPTWLQLSSAETEARLKLSYRFDQFVRSRLWLEAWEKTYEAQLKQKITSHFKKEANSINKKAMAQFVFCIDVRSEPFRRQLEKEEAFETFGTAGFFGLPIETCKLGSEHRHPSLPVMFKPQIRVKEFTNDNELKTYQQRKGVFSATSRTFKGMKHHGLASLMLPEVSGLLLTVQTFARSFVPRKAAAILRKARKNCLEKPSAELTLTNTKHGNAGLPLGFTEQEKVSYASQALKMMGLTEHFAPLVVICGHGSRSLNNPYASSLDCGACGGASSEFNARVLASLCNLREVRQALQLEGITIPADTKFIAAEHITTTDELRLIYVPDLSGNAREAYNQILQVLPKVKKKVSAERMKQLPTICYKGKNPTFEAERFSVDWSETRPEWGLARNATFIIGNRKLTRDCDLDGRAFLHNYDWQKDNSGTILANIIKGPATVTQWINLQYYASTVAPHYYGSGNKTTQTVTSGIGVMQGNSSDLLSGLPWQSVMSSDHDFYHHPLRLLVLVQAPKNYIEKLLKQDHAFHQKIENGWIRLTSIDEAGNWVSWS
ncbi:putative inorganic carbon transporter subunit DabA [Niallia sp. XMNu-256]|uniref:DUF2309 domain-containing protein n=1 Tax=Niallia sp. XMNu-256 TaxID=3082444 RepID=UPI0030D4F181